MLEQNNATTYEVTLATCPKCGATCVEGHDNDGQIMCAACGLSFMPKETKAISDAEYRQMSKDTTQRFDRGGWTAFIVK